MDTIFFDLDGTLTDPKPGITRSIHMPLQKLDIRDPDRGQTDLVYRPAAGASFAGFSAPRMMPTARCAISRAVFRPSGV